MDKEAVFWISWVVGTVLLGWTVLSIFARVEEVRAKIAGEEPNYDRGSLTPLITFFLGLGLVGMAIFHSLY